MNGSLTRALSGSLLMFLLTALSGQTTKPDATSSGNAETPRVVLVELFTSEGCSSCPPADALLRRINGKRTASGQLIVGISEHVTYWNSLGWSDPFSSPLYTDRQNAYGDAFHLDSVYTPQMVINGTEQIVGADESGLARAFRKEADVAAPITLHILSAAVVGKSLQVTFSAVASATSGTAGTASAAVRNAAILAVIADDADQSSVLRGENSGRTLAHVAVARSIQQIAKLKPAPEQTQQTVQIALPASVREAAGHHLILFAQAPGNGRVLGVDSKPL